MSSKHKLACETSKTNTNPIMFALYRELERSYINFVSSIYLNHIYLAPNGVMCIEDDKLKIHVGQWDGRDWFEVSLNSETLMDDIVREVGKAREYDRIIADYSRPDHNDGLC